jgi:peptidoglycan/xylan/chitin deacetylase (PgdA/CDA1 family)
MRQTWTRRLPRTVVRDTAVKMLIIVAPLAVLVLSLSSCSSPRASQGDSTVAALPSTAHFAWPEGKRAAVSLSFDDARESQLDVGMPLLNAYGVKATFYVSIAPAQKRAAEWQAVLEAGHEIGNHSMRHACTGNYPGWAGRALEDYTLGQMAAELDQANTEIEKMFHVRPVTFAYPCGQKYVGRGKDVKSYVPLVAERFLAGRGWRDEGANDPGFCDPAQLMTMELDGLTFEQLKVLVDQAIQKGQWLVLCGHEIGPGGRQMVRIDTLRAFCGYARDPRNGLWVDTVARIADYVVKQRVAVQ